MKINLYDVFEFDNNIFLNETDIGVKIYEYGYYRDLINDLEVKIKERVRIIEAHQNRLNELLKVDRECLFIKNFTLETERKQRYSRKIMDKCREEIRQLKSLQRDAA